MKAKGTRIPQSAIHNPHSTGNGAALGLRLGLAVIVAFALVVGVAYIYLHDPTAGRYYPPCLFHQVTGLYCPGCGSARALYALTHGQLLTAFRHNPLAVLLLPVLIVVALRNGLRVLRLRPLHAVPVPASFGRYLILVLLLYWATRNIPLYPFIWLAP